MNGLPRGGPVAPLPLAAELMARWGIGYDAARGVLTLGPRVIPGEARVECPRFRAGRSVVAIELCTRPGGVTCRVAIPFGPPLRIEMQLAAHHGGLVMVDDVPMTGPRVAFEARSEHEVVWLGG